MDKQEILDLHAKNIGVLEIKGELPVENPEQLGQAYTPGVAQLAKLIEADPKAKDQYTVSGKLVAVISDGTAVLGLGNVGPAASLPIIEGKSLLYKRLAGVDAIPLSIDQVPVDDVVETIKNISASFAGIHLEDIAAPRVFEIEEKLAESLDIPVYHDDQTGTAIVVLAGLINAAKVVGKSVKDLKVVINGVGASGYATARLLEAFGIEHLTLVDLPGVVTADDEHCNVYQRQLAKEVTSASGSTLDDVIVGQDAFIGLSDANVLTKEQVSQMAEQPIIFALANPVPEIDPDEAKAGGAAVVATGSSQWPNQVNNILVFPGLFKGLLASGTKKVESDLQIQVANALAGMIQQPTATQIIPGVFDNGVVETVHNSVMTYADPKA